LDEEAKEFEQEIYNIIEEVDLDPSDPESKDAVNQIIEERFILKNFANIISATAERARSMTEQEWLDESTNPSAKAKAEAPEPGERTQPMDEDETLFNNLMKAD